MAAERSLTSFKLRPALSALWLQLLLLALQDGAGGQSSWSLEPVNHEGWRVTVDEGDGKRGWLLLRQSLHDPLLVLNVESDKEGGEHEQ
jgi:hypothetical protein